MSRYVFFSHDGFGLGHVRRNAVIARALLALDPAASITIVTGVPVRLPWPQVPGIHIVRVPPLMKDGRGGYRPIGMTFDEAVTGRAAAFLETVARRHPDVVVVDRHPYGTAGELRDGLELARRKGAAAVLGLRDVLDDPEVIIEEVRSAAWEGVEDLFVQVLVYGSPRFCDHEAEYGLPLRPRYCGWVTESVPPAPRRRSVLAVAAGGGGGGGPVFRLGVDLLERRPSWRAEFVAGPYADLAGLFGLVGRTPARRRLTVATNVPGCGPLFSRAAAVLQMAGYNSTFEALAAGHRSILVPRRAPRREQTIRAERLAALGLADVIDEEAEAADVDDLLDRPRRLTAGQVAAAGIRLDGAHRAAALLSRLAGTRSAA